MNSMIFCIVSDKCKLCGNGEDSGGCQGTFKGYLLIHLQPRTDIHLEEYNNPLCQT